ncbi:MAG TPA: GNAT family N-acetyltransferase [Armatimonadota bacterium]|nr:GNAT family N-acetyltransferase [Armatimonadota bacterium]
MKSVAPMVRRAAVGDADALFVLVERFARSFRPGRDVFQEVLERLLQDDCAWLSVAECSGCVVGYCLGFDHDAFYANGRVSAVEEIAVTPDQRRKGVGRALMTAFEEWARSRGSKLVGLATRRAAPFYAALGYEESAVYFRKVL